jgi:TonB family protein
MDAMAIQRDWTGRVIDEKYRLLQWLGGSESSGVFLTELPERKASIKLIPASGRDAEAQLACWAATTSLSHPHLTRLLHYGRGEIDGAPLLYTVTDYAPEILSQVLPERPLTPAETREMLDPVLGALTYLHGKGFVHGHIKPSNFLVVGEQLKLSSDGLSVEGKQISRNSTADIYDAPEAAAGSRTPAADIWSLGVTLVEVLTQHPPAWNRATQKEPVVPESMPQPFAGIARECLHTDPALRCTLGEIRTRLDPARSLPKAAGKINEEAPAKSHSTALVVAVLVLIAVFAIVRMQSHKAPPAEPAGTPPPTSESAAPPTQSPISQPPVPEASGSNDAAGGAVVERVMPDVLPGALRSIQGQVDVNVRVTVDANGNVSNAALESAGPSKYFVRVALEAAQQWKFKPVPGAWILQFQFTPAGAEVTPVEATP